MPTGYGIEPGSDGCLPWSWAEERLVASRSYWLCTTRPDGRPHAVPVWAVWLDAALLFSSDPSSTKGRNLAVHPAAVVHLESGDDVVVVEGRVDTMRRERLATFVEAYAEKYAHRVDVTNPAFGLYELVPDRVLAWRERDFPTSATRFRRTV